MKRRKLARLAPFRLLVFSACLLVFAAAVPAHGQPRQRRAGAPPAPPPPAQGPQQQTAPVEVGEDEVVRVETTLVTIPVSVTDRQGRYVPDLAREDFRVFEDGVEQSIAYFASVEKPFTVVLMIDTSSSVWSKLGRIKEAANAFVDQLRADDRVMVVSFAGGPTLECEATSDRARVREAIRKTGKGMSTHLYDSVEWLTGRLGEIQGRKAVVLFTDGVDARSSRSTYEGTVQLVEELDAIFYTIRYDTYSAEADAAQQPQGPPAPARRLPGILGKILGVPSITIGGGGGGGGSRGSSRADYERGERYLHELAELTGGRYYDAGRDLGRLDETFRLIAEELRRQYSLGYYPQTEGRPAGRRRIRVRVERPDLAVRARDGYVFKPAADKTARDQEQKKPAPSAPVLKKPFTVASTPTRTKR